MLTEADSRLAAIIAEQEAIFIKRQPRSAELRRRGRLGPRRRRHLELADHPAAAGLAQPRRRRQGLRRRRQRVRGPARRLRRRPGRARPSGHRRGGQGPGGARHPLRAADARTRSSVAGELSRRWGLPRWRFANSGTEATMDAVHLMRSYTGRDLIIKVEGGYHGHHDSVQVSVMPDDRRRGPARPPEPGPVLERHPAAPSPASRWSPSSTTWTASRRLLEDHPGQVAGHDRRAGHDERRHHPPAARATWPACATCCTTTARCSPSTRSRPASPSAPAA